ncbi:MAG TPA: NAD(P)H-dependent oxidoreductase [Thermomicrobiales bacterium]|nr:NAD(P)H-dependent oxidoreductase [Thermomicrobiales bacterium]
MSDATGPIKLGIIIASTRPGRVGLPVGQWVAQAAAEHGGFEIDVIDHAEVNLPLMDEPAHPRLRQYTHDHTIAWSERIDALDAFVVVMPEYNYGFTAPLKNALDYLSQEWQYKAIGIVSYGGLSGGLRAVQMLKPVLLALKLSPINEAVAITAVSSHLDDEGVFEPTESLSGQARTMFAEIQRWVPALRPLRAPALA